MIMKNGENWKIESLTCYIVAAVKSFLLHSFSPRHRLPSNPIRPSWAFPFSSFHPLEIFFLLNWYTRRHDCIRDEFFPLFYLFYFILICFSLLHKHKNGASNETNMSSKFMFKFEFIIYISMGWGSFLLVGGSINSHPTSHPSILAITTLYEPPSTHNHTRSLCVAALLRVAVVCVCVCVN